MHNSGNSDHQNGSRCLAKNRCGLISKALHGGLMGFLTVISSSALATPSYNFASGYYNIEEHEMNYKIGTSLVIGTVFVAVGAKILTLDSSSSAYHTGLFLYYYAHVCASMNDPMRVIITLPVATLGLSSLLIEDIIAANNAKRENDIEAQRAR